MKNIEDLLIAPINPDFSLGNISINITVQEFIEKYVSYEYKKKKILDVGVVFPSTVVYSFFSTILFHFDIPTGKLERIHFRDQFQGKYRETIGIGATIGQLRSIHSDLAYDDDYIFVDDKGILTFVADEDVVSMPDEEIDKCKIEAIIIKP